MQWYVNGKKVGKPVRLAGATAKRTFTFRRTSTLRVVYLGNETTLPRSSRTATVRVR